MDWISGLLSALGLAGSAGLNAWIPLFIVGVADRFLPPGWFHLPERVAFMHSTWFLVLTGVLLLVELVADKIPVVDHINDTVQAFIRPVAGAVLFLAGTGALHLHPAVPIVLGLITAGAVHTAKAGFRPMVTLGTGGLGNPVVSLVEDVIAFVATLIALLAPLLIVGVIIVSIWALANLGRRQSGGAQDLEGRRVLEGRRGPGAGSAP